MVAFQENIIKVRKNYFLSVFDTQKGEEQLCKNRIVIGLMELAI